MIPGLISLYYVLRGELEKAFLNVFLPCTFLVPYYYGFRLPHLPDLSAGAGALLPLGLAVLFRPKTPWKFRRMDLWVVLFMISYAMSEVLRENVPKDGMVLWMQSFVEKFLAYVVGRQLIEPNLRLTTIKRIVFLFMIQAPFALFEFRFGRNFWIELAPRLGIYPAWFVQLRGGTARIATAFGDTILAGIIFLIAACLNYYLVQLYKQNKTILGERMSMLQKYRLPLILLPLFVYMTASRMPEACTVLAFLLMQIPRFKKMKTGAIIILLVVVVFGGSVYAVFQKYTNVSDDQVTDEAQSSAIYRKQLVIAYGPTLEQGGWLGWGLLSTPAQPGMTSVDNHYMLTQLSQGKLGKYLLQIIAVESILTLVIFATKFRNKESQFLVFSMMGALAGTFVAMTTVYMGEQLPQILFLVLGWSQSLQDTSVLGAGVRTRQEIPEGKFRFRRVIA